MELLTPDPLYVSPTAVVFGALPIAYMVLFVRAMRPAGFERLHRFTAFTMVLGAALPVLDILLVLLRLNMFQMVIADLSPIPTERLYGYIEYLPFIFFTIMAIVLLRPKAPRDGLQVGLTWGVVLLVNLALSIMAAYQIITWAEPAPPTVDTQHLQDGYLDPAEIIIHHTVHPTRERIALSLTLPALWTVISATALYKAFSERRRGHTNNAGSAPQHNGREHAC